MVKSIEISGTQVSMDPKSWEEFFYFFFRITYCRNKMYCE